MPTEAWVAIATAAWSTAAILFVSAYTRPSPDQNKIEIEKLEAEQPDPNQDLYDRIERATEENSK